MRKITNAEEVNQFYDIVNEYVDEYIIKYKVKPSNLKRYFNSDRVDIFLKKYNIDDVENIKTVVRDVIEDRYNAEKDNIIKFESFINEDMGNVQIDESGVSHERILSDLYHTSIGHIEAINIKDHKYKVTDLNKKLNVVIYSKKDVQDFKNSLISIMLKEIKLKKIDLGEINVGLESNRLVKTGVKVILDNLIDDEKMKNYLSDVLIEGKVLLIIKDFINSKKSTSYNYKPTSIYNYKEEYKEYHIWELTKLV